jgi:bacteriochlorophyllide a dehydrogenase
MQAKAVIFSAVNKVELTDFEQRQPAGSEILIETAYSSISPGTELRCLSGKEKNAGAFPFVPGYATSGRVIAAGPESLIVAGSRVFCSGTDVAGHLGISWGGQVSHAICDSDAAVELPDALEFKQASLIALAGIPYHGMRLARPVAGEKVVVCGLGAIGQFSARLFALSGADVVGIDISASRVKLLRESGVKALQVKADYETELKTLQPDGADIIVDATGRSNMAEILMPFAKDIPWDNTPEVGARYVIQGSFSGTAEIPYMEAFNREISLLFPRDNQKRDKLAVANLMSRGILNSENIISKTVAPEAAADAYHSLQENPEENLTVIFDWQN